MGQMISTINKLHMVRFYHLFGKDGPLCGILAYYQDKTINLCSADEGFSELFDRIAKVYERESQYSDIIADDETRQILQTANAFPEESFEKCLSAYTELKAPMIAPKAFSHIYILPIVKYVLGTLYKAEGGELSFQDMPRHWFGKGVLDAMNRGQELHFPYQIVSDMTEFYQVTLRDVLSAGNTLDIRMLYDSDGVTVSYYDHDRSYKGAIDLRGLKYNTILTHTLTQKNAVVLAVEDALTPAAGGFDNERIFKLTGTVRDVWRAYELPWGEKVYSADKDGCGYLVFSTTDNGMSISHCSCFQNLTEGERVQLLFGKYSFRLYEREDITELHLLDPVLPGSGRYREKYAGRIYGGDKNAG